MTQPLVAVLMGSDSVLGVMERTFKVLKALTIPFQTKIISAHLTPEAIHAYVNNELHQRLFSERRANANSGQKNDTALQAKITADGLA